VRAALRMNNILIYYRRRPNMQNLKELITIENKKRYNEIMMFNHRAFIISTRSQHPYVENV